MADGNDVASAGGGNPSPAIRLHNINKHFGPVHANKNITLSVGKGTVHGIIGENGAGKSTLMSILYGFYQADSGEIFINGKAAAISSPDHALAAGIGMVHQHFMLVEPFTVLENVMLGKEGGAVLAAGQADARSQLERLEREYGLEVNPDALIADLPVGLRQRVEILKALYRGADTLILDEPTGVLTPQEADQLFKILDALRTQGKTIILITHKLREIMAITDNVTVMRQGEVVANVPTADTDEAKLAELMVGRSVLLRVEKQPPQPGRTVLCVRNLEVVDPAGVRRVKDVSFDVRGGEIVGIAGVSGNGQTELLEALSGIVGPTAGSIEITGNKLTGNQPVDGATVRGMGLGHVPEDRQSEGLITSFPAWECAILGYHTSPAYNGTILMHGDKIVGETASRMEDYDVRPRNPMLKAANFSGGNQQKIVVARELEQDPDLLLVGQPTRGVDIGAIEFIHSQLVDLRDRGKGILLVSVELDEILSLADRILVMFDGFIVGEVPAAEANEQRLGLMMAGIADGAGEARP